MAEAPTFLIEGVLPEELAGAARGSDPLRFAEDLSRARKACDGEAVERHHDLVVARWLGAPFSSFEQLGPQWSQFGYPPTKARSVRLQRNLTPVDTQHAWSIGVGRQRRQLIETEESLSVSRSQHGGDLSPRPQIGLALVAVDVGILGGVEAAVRRCHAAGKIGREIGGHVRARSPSMP